MTFNCNNRIKLPMKYTLYFIILFAGAFICVANTRAPENYVCSIELQENEKTIVKIPLEISALCGVGLSRLRCWLSPRCTSLPCTRSLVKLADFFGCSLLYLLGLEEENSLTRPRTNLPDFSKRLLLLKERHEIKIYMLKRTGRLGAASSFYNWTKRGSLPDVYNLLALSDVFRCTPDFLLGRED